jgi:hypothetical protein
MAEGIEALLSRTLSDEEKKRHLAEAFKAEAEARKLLAESREAEAKAETAEIKLAETREDDAARKQNDEHKRVYRFQGVVDSASTKALTRTATSRSCSTPLVDQSSTAWPYSIQSSLCPSVVVEHTR